MARAEAAFVDVPVEARSGLEEYVFQLIYAAAEKRRRILFSGNGKSAEDASAGASSPEEKGKKEGSESGKAELA